LGDALDAIPRFLQRGGKWLKGKGMRVALLHESAKEQWRVASREMEIAWGATPGKHTKSAEAIEKKQDGFRSGAKERKGVNEERGWKACADGKSESERGWKTFLRRATRRRIARIAPFVYHKVLKSID
jgi:hypothetical protein